MDETSARCTEQLFGRTCRTVSRLTGGEIFRWRTCVFSGRGTYGWMDGWMDVDGLRSIPPSVDELASRSRKERPSRRKGLLKPANSGPNRSRMKVSVESYFGARMRDTAVAQFPAQGPCGSPLPCRRCAGVVLSRWLPIRAVRGIHIVDDTTFLRLCLIYAGAQEERSDRNVFLIFSPYLCSWGRLLAF